MAKRPKQRYVVRDAYQLAAVVSPVRHHLLRTLTTVGPESARELAQRLGRSPESLYYHLRGLEEAGLVVQTETRSRNGRPEAVWSAVARDIYTDPKQTSPEYVEAMQRSAAALLRLAARQVHAALERQRETGGKRPPSVRCMQLHARLSPAAVRELARRLDEVLAFLRDSDDPDAGEMVAVTVTSAPVIAI